MNTKRFIARVFSLIIVVVTLLTQISTGEAAGISADGFNPGANGTIHTLAVQVDGKILVGGAFSTLGGTLQKFLGRLYPDGTIDTSFSPEINGIVYAIAIQQNGKILVGGNFSVLGGNERSNIGRLNADGTLDTSFDPGSGTNGTIYAIAVQPDGKVITGGNFTMLNGSTCNNIGRFNSDGTIDTCFTTGANGQVNALAVLPTRKILVGGTFSSLGGGTQSNIGLLNRDGTLETEFNPMANGAVNTFAIQPDGKILVGGDFSKLAGEDRNSIGRLNADGSLDGEFNPGADNSIKFLGLQPDGKILVGGAFTTLVGSARSNIGRLLPGGTLDTGFNPVAGGTVYTMAVQPDGKLLVGGAFTTLAGGARNNIGRLYPDGSLDADLNLNLGLSDAINTLAIQPDGKILVGGAFTSLGGSARNRLGRINVDGTLDANFDPTGLGVGGSVVALAVQPDGKILVGGNFSSLAGGNRNNIGRLNADGTLDTDFDPGTGTNGTVYALDVQPDGKILVGGSFTLLRGSTRNRIGRLNTDGTLDIDFDTSTGANGTIYTISTQPNGKVLVGGFFSTLGGSPHMRIGRLNADGTLDTGFNQGTNAGDETIVNSIALQPDGKILVGGAFATLGGSTHNNIGRLNSNGSLDPGFNADANGMIKALAVQSDGRILLGGDFEILNDHTRNYIGRLNADGTLDSGFNPGAGDSVTAFAIQPDGKILVVGTFTTLGTRTCIHFGRLSTNMNAWQNLTSENSNTTLTWRLGGAGPEPTYVFFESSTDGVNFNPLGMGTPILGGWKLNGLNLLENQNLYILARGYYRSGQYDGSLSIIESVRNIYVDNTKPTVQSSIRSAPTVEQTNYSTVGFTVTFNESVTGVDEDDFYLATTGISDAFVSAVESDVTGTVYTVTINTGTGEGMLRLDVVDNGSIEDLASNQFYGSFTSGETYMVDRTAPTVLTITRAGINPTIEGSVVFTVTFSEPVTGVGIEDFTLTTTDIADGTTAIDEVSGSDTTYTVTVDRGSVTGEVGFLRLDVVGGTSIADLATNLLDGGFTEGETYTIGNVPVVSSIKRKTPTNPTTGNPTVQFTVTFSENVTGVDLVGPIFDDFALTTSSGTSDAYITDVTGSNRTYVVTVNTGSTSGILRLDVVDNDTIQKTPIEDPPKLLGGAGLGNGSYTRGQVYYIDKSGPSVISIVRAGPNPTNASYVNFTVTFSKSVKFIEVTDFTLTPGGGVVEPFVTGVSGSDTAFTVTVNTGSGNGTLLLNLSDTNSSIKDIYNNLLVGPGSTGGGTYTSDESYTIDKTAPTVISSVRVDPEYTNAEYVRFMVTFSEPVIGVVTGGFTLANTGMSDAAVTAVSGSGATRTVTVYTGIGEGTLRLDVVEGATIIDVATNSLSSGFTSGQAYTLDTLHPTVLSSTHADPNPTRADSVNFTVEFSEAVIGVDETDFSLTTTGITAAYITGVTSVSDTIYTVSVQTGSGSGTIRINLDDNNSILDIRLDPLGVNPLGGPLVGDGDFNSGDTYTIDRIPPTLELPTSFTQEAIGEDAWVIYPVTVSDNLDPSPLMECDPASDSYFPIGDTPVECTATDASGNSASGNFVVTISPDTIPPTVNSIFRSVSSPDPTNAASINFEVIFSEPVKFVDVTDFTLYVDGVTGAEITGVVGSEESYIITANTGTGSGTIRLDVAAAPTIQDFRPNEPYNFLGGGYTGDEFFTIDRTPPVLNLPIPEPVEATSASGAEVSYTVSATDDDPLSPIVTCTPPSGSTFPLGSTSVSCSATDTIGNIGSGSFIILVQDTTPPLMTLPPSITQEATSPTGAVVDFSASASDLVDPAPVVTCDPPSGSIFPLGITSVSCSAADTSENTDTGSFNVTVQDTTPPVMTLPSDITQEMTGPSGAVVDFIINASDLVDLAPVVTCDPPSGSTFPLGTTLVSCIATDASFNTSLPGVFNVIVQETIPPVVNSIVRIDTSPTNASSVNFMVTFSESVTGVDSGDFTISKSGGLSGYSVSEVSTDSGATRTVSVNTGSGSGTLRLDVILGASIMDLANNPLDGGYSSGEVYTIDRTMPVVNSIVRANLNYTNATIVNFTVTFSESVIDVDNGDFVLTESGGLSGSTIANVSADLGATRTVAVNTGSGIGTLRLDVVDTDSIHDLVGNPLRGADAGNGDFTTGQVYAIGSPYFSDVPFDFSKTLGGKRYKLHDFIQAISDAGFTNGCVMPPNPYFCPDIQLNRAMIAKFLLNVVHGASYTPPSTPEPPHFIDSWTDTLGGDGSWGQPWVEELYAAGLTIGTVNGPAPNFYYSPWGAVTRIQAAKWALFMAHGTDYTPPAATGKLADVFCADPDVGNLCWGVAWAEQAYAEDLILPCGTNGPGNPPNFCPNDAMDRPWTAYMIAKAKGLDVLYDFDLTEIQN